MGPARVKLRNNAQTEEVTIVGIILIALVLNPAKLMSQRPLVQRFTTGIQQRAQQSRSGKPEDAAIAASPVGPLPRLSANRKVSH